MTSRYLGRAAALARVVLDRLPRHNAFKVAKGLVSRANLARDANRLEIAAWLYEEALRFTPGRARIHVQCGHVYKEMGDFPAAEAHYEAALRLLPDDTDLALQLGHFYKVAARHDEATAAYKRALELHPGWAEAAEEVARLQGANGHDDQRSGNPGAEALVIRELLPRPKTAPTHYAKKIELRRFAPRRMQHQGGIMKALSGIEAIRGFAISAVALDAVQVILGEDEIARAALTSFPIDGSATDRKYVFNIWHDFTNAPPGIHRIELRMLGPKARGPVHRDQVLIAAPNNGPDALESDALVPILTAAPGALEDAINALPSMARPAKRSILPAEIRTVLVQRADQLGDLVCSVPAIERLRELFPGARLIGLLTVANAELGQRLGLFDEIVVADFAEDPGVGRRSMTAEAQGRLRATLEPYRFDLAIDLCEVSDSRPLLLLSGASFLYGFKSHGAPVLSADFDMHARDPVNGLEIISASKKILALVESLGALRAAGARPMTDPDLRREALIPYGIDDGDRFAVLHTGARLPYTRWPHFAELVKLLLARRDLKLVLIRDAASDTETLPQSDRLLVLTGRLPFDDFDALLSFASVFVGNDSGTKHLAALRGTPAISLHMARLNWSEWGQENSGTIISRRVPCAGCGIHNKGEECGQDFACIRFIRAAEVYEAVAKLVD